MVVSIQNGDCGHIKIHSEPGRRNCEEMQTGEMIVEWDLEAVARDDPGHALELVEVILVRYEGVSQAPEDEQTHQNHWYQRPQIPVGYIRVSRQGAK